MDPKNVSTRPAAHQEIHTAAGLIFYFVVFHLPAHQKIHAAAGHSHSLSVFSEYLSDQNGKAGGQR